MDVLRRNELLILNSQFPYASEMNHRDKESRKKDRHIRLTAKRNKSDATTTIITPPHLTNPSLSSLNPAKIPPPQLFINPLPLLSTMLPPLYPYSTTAQLSSGAM